MQIVGLSMASLLISFGESCYQFPTQPFYLTPSSVRWEAWILSIAIILFTQPGLQALRRVYNFVITMINPLRTDPIPRAAQQPDRSWHFNLIETMRRLALIDIFGVWACIRMTGGVEGSIFSPCLFILPTIVILIAECGLMEVFFWAACCLLAFALSLEPFNGFAKTNVKGHYYLLCASTIACTLFPLIYVSTARPAQRCPQCNGTGRVTTVQPEVIGT